MDEEKIVLIGNESDLLHCGYNFAIKDNGKRYSIHKPITLLILFPSRYPSATHFSHYQILLALAIPEVLVEELLCTASGDVHQKAMVILQENMPDGHDMNSLASYLTSSLHSYSLQGLRLRAQHDKGK